MSEKLKQAHIEETTVPPPTQFGDMKQDLPKRKYIAVRSFAANPWMRGFAPPMPSSSSAAEMLESHIRQMPTQELQRFYHFLKTWITAPLSLLVAFFFLTCPNILTIPLLAIFIWFPFLILHTVYGLITWNLVSYVSMA
jgi:hypothetical protein